MPNNISSFSLTHAAILDGTTPAELADIYGVSEGSLEVDTDSYERTGDDRILSTVRWINRGTLSLSSTYIPLDLLEKMYGTPAVIDDATGSLTMQLWTQKSMNLAPRPVLVEAPGSDQAGNPFTLRIILYKVQFGPMAFDQFMSYKEGLAVSFEGDALLSDTDELGQPFDDELGARIGKIVAVNLLDPTTP